MWPVLQAANHLGDPSTARRVTRVHDRGHTLCYHEGTGYEEGNRDPGASEHDKLPDLYERLTSLRVLRRLPAGEYPLGSETGNGKPIEVRGVEECGNGCHNPESKELHDCPYAEELYPEYHQKCHCCEECEYQCAMDV